MSEENQPEPQLIGSSRLGAELSADECEILAREMAVHRLTDGQVLCHEGEVDSALYLLVSGSISVVNKQMGNEVTVYTMNEGETAGTRVFVNRRNRTSTLRSRGESTVYSLEPARFEGLVDSQPQLVYKVMRTLLQITHENLMRMNRETEQLSNYVRKTGGRY